MISPVPFYTWSSSIIIERCLLVSVSDRSLTTLIDNPQVQAHRSSALSSCAIGSVKPSKDHGTNYPMVDDLLDRCLLKQFLNKRVRCRGARHPPLSLVYTMSVMHMVPAFGAHDSCGTLPPTVSIQPVPASLTLGFFRSPRGDDHLITN